MKVYRSEDKIVIENPEHGQIEEYSGYRESQKKPDKNSTSYTILFPCYFTSDELKAIIETPEIYELLYEVKACPHLGDKLVVVINGETISIKYDKLLKDLKCRQSNLSFSNRLKVRKLSKGKSIVEERNILLNKKHGKLTLKEIYEIYFSNEPLKKCHEKGIPFKEFLSILESGYLFLDSKELFDSIFKDNKKSTSNNSIEVSDEEYETRRRFFKALKTSFKLIELYTSDIDELKRRIDGEEMLFENYVNLIGYYLKENLPSDISMFPEFEKTITGLLELYDKYHENYSFAPSYGGQKLLEKYSISPEIIQTFLGELESLKEYNLTDAQKAIYLYRRICQKFSYDDEFFATGQLGGNLPHKILSRLEEFNFDKNLVVCINIAFIYAKVCQAAGIKAELRENGVFYDLQNSHSWIYSPNNPDSIKHPFVLVWADGYEIAADPAIGLVDNDMQFAKVGKGPKNLTYIGHNEELKYSFEKEKAFVDRIIVSKERDYEYYDINDMLTRFSHSASLSEEEIEQTFMSIIEEINTMPGTMMAKFHAIRELWKKMPRKSGVSIDLLGVGDNIPVDKRKKASLSVIITITYKNESHYYFVKSEGNITKLSKEELTNLIMSDKISYLSDEHSMIPGIEVSKDKVR